jgi:hypothetical protein
MGSIFSKFIICNKEIKVDKMESELDIRDSYTDGYYDEYYNRFVR